MIPTSQQLQNRETWFHDLEHGTAPQGQNVLHSTTGYCCLARACEVVGKPQGLVFEDSYMQFHESSNLHCYGYLFHLPPNSPRNFSLSNTQTIPSDIFAEWFGVPRHTALDILTNCMQANDNLNWTFAQIASSLRHWFAIADAGGEVTNICGGPG
jgi:hypothetical protein